MIKFLGIHFYWRCPLLFESGGPYYWGIGFKGFQLGYWERPESYAKRLDANKNPDL